MKVHIFVPCFVDQLYPQVAFNMVKVLEKAGCEVVYNTNQTCCGQPAFNAGFWGESKDVCSKFLEDFKDAEYIVGPSASCVGFVRNYYQKLFKDTPEEKKADQIGSRAYEFAEFLVKVLGKDDFNATFFGKATYHDSCAALREIGIKQEPRQLLSKVNGLELIEMNDNETCCGFGGTFAVKYAPISVAMGDQKVNNALAAGVEYIISTDVSCLMHLEGYIKKHGHDLKIAHLADVLACGW